MHIFPAEYISSFAVMFLPKPILKLNRAIRAIFFGNVFLRLTPPPQKSSKTKHLQMGNLFLATRGRANKMMPGAGYFYHRLEFEITHRAPVTDCPQFSEILGKSMVIHLSPKMASFGR